MRSRGFGVTYKRFGYGAAGGVEPWRVCYWGHPPGYWSDIPFRNCQNPDTDTHTINLAVIRDYYAKQFAPELGFVIKTEPRLRRPGDPPRPYSPDLAIFGSDGKRMVAVEYQRSHETYEKFADRDDLRRSEGWAAVDWWFDDTQPNPDAPRKTVYDKSEMHRTHLASIGVHHFRCWVDLDTLRLQAEYGRPSSIPPDRRIRVDRRIEKAVLANCSTAKLIRELEGEPEHKYIKQHVQPLRPRTGSELQFLADVNYSIEREQRVALAVIKRQQRLAEQDRRHREYAARLMARRQAARDAEDAVRRIAQDRQRAADEERLRLQQMEEEKWQQIQLSEPVNSSRYSVRFALNLKVGNLIRRGPGFAPEVYQGQSGAGYSTDRYTYASIEGWQVKTIS